MYGLHGKFTLFAALFYLCACNERGESTQLGESHVRADEPEIANRLIQSIKQASLQHYPEGEVKRFNQAKGLGCFSADFAVAQNLPAELQQGLFRSGQVYPARIRFANASELDDSKKDFHGMSIKLSNVGGKSLWGQDGVQDFLLNSHPVLFAATPEDFLSFVEAVRDDAVWKYFINPQHLYSLLIVLKGRERIASPFDIRYWSTTPYRFGNKSSVAVKYSVKPCSSIASGVPDKPSSDYLTTRMEDHLRNADACFDFMVQFQTDPKAMPVEDASVEWSEGKSPFQKLATITIKEQDFQSVRAREQCEHMSFNPWQSLMTHEPIGGINRVRKPIYSELAKFRDEESRRRGRIE